MINTYVVHHIPWDEEGLNDCSIHGELHVFRTTKSLPRDPTAAQWQKIIKECNIPYTEYKGNRLELYYIDVADDETDVPTIKF